MSSINESNNEKSNRSSSISFTVTIENTVIIAIILSLLGIIFSIALTIFYEPSWVKETINANKRLCSKINNEKLVLIGGGTVYEYIKESGVLKKYYEIVDSSCLISVRIPTTTALKTLKDETKNNDEWLVMSSIKASPKDFMDQNEIVNFKKEKRIIEVFLKRDKLFVITTKDEFFKPFFKSKEKISSIDLKNLLSKANSLNFDIYTTSEESGTFATYQKEVEKDVLKGSKKFELNTIYPENKPFVILGSCIYKPKNFNYENHNTYYVYNAENKFVEKELYLYFGVTYNNDSKIEISKEIMRFLKCVRSNYEIPKVQSELIIRDPLANKD